MGLTGSRGNIVDFPPEFRSMWEKMHTRQTNGARRPLTQLRRELALHLGPEGFLAAQGMTTGPPQGQAARSWQSKDLEGPQNRTHEEEGEPGPYPLTAFSHTHPSLLGQE